jgi:hypothetical protein
MIILNRFTKFVISTAIIVIIIVIYFQFVVPLLPVFNSLDESVKNVIMIIVLSSLLFTAHKIKEKYKESFGKPLHLVERFALIILPLQPIISMIHSTQISLYWIYFPFIICSVLWIGGSLHGGGYDLIKQSVRYRLFFIYGCLILICVGLSIYISLGFVYYCQPNKLFTWLEPIIKC